MGRLPWEGRTPHAAHSVAVGGQQQPPLDEVDEVLVRDHHLLHERRPHKPLGLRLRRQRRHRRAGCGERLGGLQKRRRLSQPRAAAIYLARTPSPASSWGRGDISPQLIPGGRALP